jgi:hypothetical protein
MLDELALTCGDAMTDAYRMLASEVILTTSNNTIIFRENGSGTNRTATIAPGSYYLDFSGDAKDLAKAIVDAMIAGSGIAATYAWIDVLTAFPQGGVYGTIEGSSTWTFNFSASTFPLVAVGFDPSEDLTHILEHSIGLAGKPCLVTFNPSSITSILEPSSYESDGAYHYRTPSGRSYAGRTAQPVRVWPCLWEYVDKRMALALYEDNGLPSWDSFWRYIHDGRRVRIVHIVGGLGVGASVPVAIGRLTPDSRRQMRIERDSPEPRFRIECAVEEDMGA